MLERKKALAERLGVSIRTLDRWARQPETGLIKRKQGNVVLFDTSKFSLPIAPEDRDDEYVSSGSVYC